jgi:hypothetical protein
MNSFSKFIFEMRSKFDVFFFERLMFLEPRTSYIIFLLFVCLIMALIYDFFHFYNISYDHFSGYFRQEYLYKHFKKEFFLFI